MKKLKNLNNKKENLIYYLYYKNHIQMEKLLHYKIIIININDFN